MMKDHAKRPALIIEDEMLVAWATREIVERAGFDPVMVVTTDLAAQMAAESGLELIVCDLDLGEITANGFDILKQLDPQEKIATVIYTGINQNFLAEAIAARRPKSVILNKPASEAELQNAVREALAIANSGNLAPEEPGATNRV